MCRGVQWNAEVSGYHLFGTSESRTDCIRNGPRKIAFQYHLVGEGRRAIPSVTTEEIASFLRAAKR